MLKVLQLALVDTAASAKARDIALRLVEGQACTLLGQEEALRILARNLLDNAIKYSPVGGTVELALYREAQTLVLQVQDSGPGIPPTERARVLDRFYRVPGAEGTGSGLGLAIVQTIAELHGAVLQLDSATALGGLQVRVRFSLKGSLASPLSLTS
jgi:two-component system OmpR family sensor kinase